MPRIAFADPARDPEAAALAEVVRQQRGKLLDPYRMLLHSPPVAAGWLGCLTAVGQQSTLKGKLRELVILRVALLTRASYQYELHVPVALAEGLSAGAITALADWRAAEVFSETERAVLAYTDAMTIGVRVPIEVFEAISSRFDSRRVVELTVTIAAYNMVARFLEALGIWDENAA